MSERICTCDTFVGPPHQTGVPWGKQHGNCLLCYRHHHTPTSPAPVVLSAAPAPVTPGAALKSLLEDLGVQESQGCGCKDKARQMDAWGLAGCRKRKDEIAVWIKEGAWKLKPGAVIGLAIRALRKGIKIHPTRPFLSLVEEALRRCERSAPPPVIQVHVAAHGIGDNVTALHVLPGLRKKFPKHQLVVVAAGHAARWLDLFEEPDLVVTHEGVAARTFYPVDNGDPVARPEHYARRCGVKAEAPKVKTLPESALRWAERYRGCFVLVPQAAHGNRVWPRDLWMQLERALLRAGQRCVVLATPGTDTGLLSEAVSAPPTEPIAALMKGAACVIGNDSGMAHVAGALGARVVALCGPTRGQRIFGHYPRVRWLDAPGGHLPALSPQAVLDAAWQHADFTDPAPEAGLLPSAAWFPAVTTALRLDQVPAVILTCPKYRGRAEVLRESLLRIGLTDVRLHEGAPADPYWHGLNQSYLDVLAPETPVLTFEDDAWPTEDFLVQIDIPGGAEVAYLGGTAGALEDVSRGTPLACPFPDRKSVRVDPLVPGWVRPFNVPSMHGVLWREPSAIRLYRDLLERFRRDLYCDTVLARCQPGLRCALPVRPLVTQDDGKNDAMTRYTDLLKDALSIQ